MMTTDEMASTPPLVYVGGKRTVASLVWQRLGNPDMYTEPFGGSLAVLLQRPHLGRYEQVGDADCMISNFWRAVQKDPDAVAEHADYPIHEADLHARNNWLIDHREGLQEKLEADPEWFDSKIAGWWVHGISAYVAPRHWLRDKSKPRPRIGTSGIHRHFGPNPRRDTCDQHRDFIQKWMRALQNRLRQVVVCCGDWKRTCSSPTTTYGQGVCGVFLDPPYGIDADRYEGCYTKDSTTVAADVREWCKEWGRKPKMRIALCGYEGEHEELEDHGWSVVKWKAQGGFANQSKDKENTNRHRERIWFSESCLKNPRPSFFDL